MQSKVVWPENADVSTISCRGLITISRVAGRVSVPPNRSPPIHYSIGFVFGFSSRPSVFVISQLLGQSCPRRARRGQEQARFAARYAGYEPDAP